jgi:hypothetical protein
MSKSHFLPFDSMVSYQRVNRNEKIFPEKMTKNSLHFHAIKEILKNYFAKNVNFSSKYCMPPRENSIAVNRPRNQSRPKIIGGPRQN